MPSNKVFDDTNDPKYFNRFCRLSDQLVKLNTKATELHMKNQELRRTLMKAIHQSEHADECDSVNKHKAVCSCWIGEAREVLGLPVQAKALMFQEEEE